ncbi:hypothetical protein [Undibacterium sp.]|jgi:hypothetical protein|uniref:hypothetical protein n=1 Tax=Undibacterium sp. TaxID=1914977 RepID=UPI002CA3F04A|nr:hypothetical protein [Undibacterium sp.]HTD06220.1 hypothetical protein [Undibacterium sp.]
MNNTQQRLNQVQESGDELSQQLATVTAVNIALKSQLERKNDEKLALRQEIIDLRRDFTADVFRLLAANELAEEGFRAAQAQLLTELERQRKLNDALRKELEKNQLGCQ